MKLSANKIKELRSLGASKKERKASSYFIVEGEKLVNEALSSAHKVTEVYKTAEIGEEAMQRISSLKTPSPILAVVEKKEHSEGELLALGGQGGLFLILDGIQDPGNLGTIIRLADWFNVAGIFISPGSVEVYNPKCIQATMGAIFRVPIVYTDLPAIIGRLKSSGAEVFGTFLDGRRVRSEFFSRLVATSSQKGASVAFVMGSESFGISQEVENQIDSDNRILIPMVEKTLHSPVKASYSESLNVATATAIVLALYRLAD